MDVNERDPKEEASLEAKVADPFKHPLIKALLDIAELNSNDPDQRLEIGRRIEELRNRKHFNEAT